MWEKNVLIICGYMAQHLQLPRVKYFIGPT